MLQGDDTFTCSSICQWWWNELLSYEHI